ncbi:hypothetical protein AX16_004672 [Volvariella volvacea WC 439]|nr:hypothetical protein AX16_004672 [Volvariella volvacea WC 439]
MKLARASSRLWAPNRSPDGDNPQSPAPPPQDPRSSSSSSSSTSTNTDSKSNKAGKISKRQAKMVSETIDRALDDERTALKNNKAAKILLLGQAESGKSTILKNIQLHFAPRAFLDESANWKPIIFINLIRSVNFVIELLEGKDPAREAQERGPNLLKDNNELAILCTRLVPLRAVEEHLTTKIAGTKGILTTAEEDKIWKFYYNPRKAPEITLRPGFGWKSSVFRKQTGEKIVTCDPEDWQVLNSCTEDIASLWEHALVQQALKSYKIELKDQPGFFLNDVRRLTDEDYAPSSEDILKARVQTIGPEEHCIKIENTSHGSTEWRIYDVGGSKFQRPIWAQFFDTVNVIIFLAPISAFNQTLTEDDGMNRLTDSIQLWQDLCSNKLLSNIELIIFLNKLDVLDSKLKAGVRFADYVVSYAPRPNETKPVAK